MIIIILSEYPDDAYSNNCGTEILKIPAEVFTHKQLKDLKQHCDDWLREIKLSPENWIINWLKENKEKYLNEDDVILEGQYMTLMIELYTEGSDLR